jgi:hypothetical protein
LDPYPGGQKWSRKKRTVHKFHLLRAKGFSCSLDVLSGGLEISKLQFFGKKNDTIIFQLYFLFNVWSSKPCNAGSGSDSGFNETGSTTLTAPEENQAQDSLFLPLAALRRLRLQLPDIRKLTCLCVYTGMKKD